MSDDAKAIATLLRNRLGLLFELRKELKDVQLASPWKEIMGQAYSAPNSPFKEWYRHAPDGTKLVRVVHAHPDLGDVWYSILAEARGHEGPRYPSPQRAIDVSDAALTKAGWRLL